MGGDIIVQYRKALALQERALFFAKSLKSDETLTQEAADYDHEYDEASIDPAMRRAMLHRINELYAAAELEIVKRLRDVSSKYIELHKPSTLASWAMKCFGDSFQTRRWLGIPEWPDRDSEAIDLSIKLLASRSKKLLKKIGRKFDTFNDDQINALQRDCIENWKGVDAILALLMEEIGFLCRRVDTYCNAQVSINRLWTAYLAIAASMTLSSLNLLHSVQNDKNNSSFIQDLGAFLHWL